MAEEEKEKQEEAPAKGKKKLLMIIVAAAVVILGAGGFFVMKGSGPSGGEAHAESSDDGGHGGGHGEKSGGGHGEGESAGSPYVKLNPFIVNLQDNSGTRYLKVTVNLELDHAGSSSELETHKAKIRDSLIILLSSKSYSEIGTVEGKYRLRDEIVQRVNQFLGGGSVKTAYFTEFVIQ